MTSQALSDRYVGHTLPRLAGRSEGSFRNRISAAEFALGSMMRVSARLTRETPFRRAAPCTAAAAWSAEKTPDKGTSPR